MAEPEPENETIATVKEEQFPDSIGSGVARVPETSGRITQDEQPKRRKIDRNVYESTEDGSHIITGGDGRARWSTIPQQVGMLQDRNLFRTGPPQVKIFCLPDELGEYNNFLKLAGNTGLNMDGDPSLVLETNHEEFWRGKFYVRVTYRELFYRQLQNID